jgi:hypothetical protein
MQLPVSILPSSPRRRRRLVRVGLVLVALAAAVLAFTNLPGAPKHPADRFSGKAQVYDPSSEVHTLSRADRRAIDRTLALFVRDGMGRKDLATSYRLASPSLRSGLTLRQWTAGQVPVYPYVARPGSTSGWELQFREDDHAAIEVFLQPGKHERTGPVTVAVDLRKVQGRWLVDGLVPTAVFSKPGQKAKVFANTDLARGNPAYEAKTRLGGGWLFVPVGIVFGLLALTVTIAYLRRDRRT